MGRHSDLMQCPLFAALPQRVVESVAPRFSIKRLAEGQPLFTRGDPVDTLVVVQEGSLQISQPGGSDRSLGPGGFLGVASLLEPGLQPSTIIALEETTIVYFDRLGLNQLWRETPATAAFFHLALASRLITLLRMANERLVTLCGFPLDELDHEGLRQALQVVDDALDDHAQPAIND